MSPAAAQTSRRRRRLCWCVLLLLSACAPTPTESDGPPETIAIRASEGTTLAVDVSPDGRLVAFDLLGQLWLIEAQGGKARPITDAVLDTAEDLDPSFSPDGRHVVFRGERGGRTGLWLAAVDSHEVRQLTELSDANGYEGNAAWSPDGRVIAFARIVPPVRPADRGRSAVVLLEVASGTPRELTIEGLPDPDVCDPAWARRGDRIAFVARNPHDLRGGRIWIVDAVGGRARPVSPEATRALSPAFAPDGRRLAYFAPDADGRMQVWVQALSDSGAASGPPRRVTDQADVAPTRVRWTPDGAALVYSADGRLWRVAAGGERPAEIPFSAELTFTRPRPSLPPARFPEPGEQHPARGFTGLALSPDGRQIGLIALGKIWVIPIGGTPRAIADVPHRTTSLAWSPDGAEVAWSSGPADEEDLFAASLATRTTRRITALPGRELLPTYSPDGRHLAFVHMQDAPRLRVVDADAREVADITRVLDLGLLESRPTSPPEWSPGSDGLLLSGGTDRTTRGRATFVPLAGSRRAIASFPDAPLFLRWTSPDTIVFVRHDRIWQAAFDLSGIRGEPVPVGNDPALYLSASRDGALLFVSDRGLRLRSRDGREQQIGWPLSYTPPLPEPTLIRNVRIIDGTGQAATAPRDVLVLRGRIARIDPPGTRPPQSARVIDAAGRFAIPGLIDLHAHFFEPDLLPGFVHFGVTTIRDQGSSMAPLVAIADAIAAGALPGPRIGYGGFQFYSDWAFDDEQGRGIEPEADADHVARAVTLAEAFGAQHIKTRTFRRWDINARMVAEAHRRGLRATGHCAHELPLVAAGIDAQEHIGLCAPRGGASLYDDLIQLYRVSGIGVVPTVAYFALAARLGAEPSLMSDDRELLPFLPDRRHFGWMLDLDSRGRAGFSRAATFAREATLKLARAGVTIGTGTDIWQVPTGVHMEMEELVTAGLSPAEAIRAATAGAARILGAGDELGSIEVGKRADLVILDADPLADIRNTRRIWQVLQDGRIVDRAAILRLVSTRR